MMPASSLEHTTLFPRQRSDVLVRTVDGETVVLDRTKELVHRLNAPASTIWAECNGTQDVPAIARRLREVFDVDAETANRDVTETVTKLLELGLVSVDLREGAEQS